MMNILVIRFSSIGDIVLTTPVFRCIKQQIPASTIHFLTKESFKVVTEHNPHIDVFHYFDNNLSDIIHELKKHHFDYVIDLHKNFRSFIITSSLKARVIRYRKESLAKWLLTKLHINVMSGKHITLRSIETVFPLGVEYDGKGLEYFIPENEHISTSDLPMSHYAGYIALVIGASYTTKKLPVQKLQELCSELNYPIVLVGGKEDVEEARQIASINDIAVYNACGKFSLNESADIVRKADLVISHDTGLLYIACAFKKKVIAIWGGTSPKLDVAPFYPDRFYPDNVVSQDIIEYPLNVQEHLPYANMIVPGLSCQPCSNYGTKQCPKGHFKCMNHQDIGLIVKKAKAFLKKK